MYHKLVVTGVKSYHDAFYFTPEKDSDLLCALFAAWLKEQDPSLGFVQVKFGRGIFHSCGWSYEANTADVSQAFAVMPPVPLDSVVLSCGLVMTFDVFNTLFGYMDDLRGTPEIPGEEMEAPYVEASPEEDYVAPISLVWENAQYVPSGPIKRES